MQSSVANKHRESVDAVIDADFNPSHPHFS